MDIEFKSARFERLHAIFESKYLKCDLLFISKGAPWVVTMDEIRF